MMNIMGLHFVHLQFRLKSKIFVGYYIERATERMIIGTIGSVMTGFTGSYYTGIFEFENCSGL